MGAHDIDARTGARIARIALPCAAIGMPLAVVAGSVLLEATAVFAFVVGAVSLYVARGERIVDAIGGLAVAICLACAAGSPDPAQTALLSVFVLATTCAFLVAGRTVRGIASEGGSVDGIAAR